MSDQRLVPERIELIVGHGLVRGFCDEPEALDLFYRGSDVLSVVVGAQGFNGLTNKWLTSLYHALYGSLHGSILLD